MHPSPNSPFPPPTTHSFITVFVTVFATVIALTKDLPDVEGDQAHNIQTFATQMGVPTVANLGGLSGWGRCAVLCCAVLCCAVLCCAVLCVPFAKNHPFPPTPLPRSQHRHIQNKRTSTNHTQQASGC